MLNSVTMIQKISILPPQQGLELPRNGEGWGFCKTPPKKNNNNNKEMCEAKLIGISRGVGESSTEERRYGHFLCLYICCN